MRKNSPQNQTQKGADKPTSPRLTLRFQSIKSRDDKISNNSVNDLTSTQPKYPAYCVTMETKGDVYDFQKDDNIASSEGSVPVPENEGCRSKFTPSGKEIENSAKDSKTSAETVANLDLSLQVEKMDTSEVSSAKINGGRLSGDSNTSKEREYASDTEKEDTRRKRRKSSDNGQSRHNSVGHSSTSKNHKSPSSRTPHQDSHSEQRNSPKGKKRGSLSSSETESNPSDGEISDLVAQGAAVPASHNGNSAAANLHSPKVPPLKIVIPSGSSSLELETRERSKVSSSKTALPYVVNTAETLEASGSDVSVSGAFTIDGSKDARNADSNSSKLRDDNHPHEERFQRVTRSSQRMQAAMSNTSTITSIQMSHGNSVSSNCSKAELSGESSNEDQTMIVPTDAHPRKRKLRGRDNPPECTSNLNQLPPSTSSSCFGSEDSQQQQQTQQFSQQQPHQMLNSYQMYFNMKKQISERRNTIHIVHPKPPQGFKDYLLNRGSYVLEGNTASRLSVPIIPPPQKLEGPFKDLFIQQEKERYRLRMQHLVEREKLVLCAEQEILRVHGRAARAMVNQTTPLSACSVLKDEEIYNVLDVDHVSKLYDDKDKNIRSRYNGRLFLSWLQDVDDKWEKIKAAMLLRHHNEAESLHAVQKLDWEWKMKELAMCDIKSTPNIDDISVPMVHVSDEFDLLPA